MKKRSGRFLKKLAMLAWAFGILATIVVVGGILAKCLAGSSTVTTAIADYGTYNAIVDTTGDGTAASPVVVTGVHNLVHYETRDKIPARPDVYWGYRVNVVNNGTKPISVFTVVEHPSITAPDGKSEMEENGTAATIAPGETRKVVSLWFFMDKSPNEFVPGDWTFELNIDGQVTALKTFTVYQPSGL